jgi:POT family proton-dependent oligopeptide transporter
MCPLVIFLCRKKYKLYPPTGSPLRKAFGIWNMAIKNRWSWNPIKYRKRSHEPGFWSDVYPSKITNKPKWMDFDDAWVDEVARGLQACKVFLWYPLYWLAYGQMTNNLVSQAATMRLGGVPNDIVSNLNPIFIIILIPIMDRIVYPAIRKTGFQFTPIKRIACGFALASMAMVSAAVTQHFIYQKSPCGTSANECKNEDGSTSFADISVWVQILPYGLIGFSEIMASVTSLEYAYTKAPANMKSTVTAVSLFMNAFSSALSQALVALAEDPLLVWNYSVVAFLAAGGGVLFWLDNRKLDKREDELNMLPAAKHQPVRGGGVPVRDEEGAITKEEQEARSVERTHVTKS